MAARKGQPRPPGSGRKPGSQARASTDVVRLWIENGSPTPLDVMLGAMMEEMNDQTKPKETAKRRAHPFAVAAAPFFHAKPQPAAQSPADAAATAVAIMEAIRAARATIAKRPAADADEDA